MSNNQDSYARENKRFCFFLQRAINMFDCQVIEKEMSEELLPFFLRY